MKTPEDDEEDSNQTPLAFAEKGADFFGSDIFMFAVFAIMIVIFGIQLVLSLKQPADFKPAAPQEKHWCPRLIKEEGMILILHQPRQR